VTRDSGDNYFLYGIGSYWNRLPVKADVYHRDGYGRLHYDGTIRPGGFSSNSRTGDQ
jgi:hypothetical protein